MDYKWARDFALELINQYSIAGTVVPESYNNQADYLLRIPKLLDEAQVYVATNQGRIRTAVSLSELEQTEQAGWISYKLPEDCWQVCSSGVLRITEDGIKRYHKYRQIGADRLLIPADLGGELLLEYYRYPVLLGQKPGESDALDNTIAAQMTLPYYVAAHLLMYDNEFAYQSLYGEFESKLARLTEMPRTEVHDAEDSYGAGDWGLLDV